MLTVEDYRDFLVNKGMGREQAETIKGKINLKKAVVEITKGKISFDDVDEAVESEQGNLIDVEDEAPEVNDNVRLSPEDALMPYHPGWHDHIMGQFLADSEIFNGNPKVDALRRVVEKEMGPIVKSIAKVVQAPNADNGFHSVIEHEITIYRIHHLEDGQAPYMQTIQEVGDVFKIEDNDYTIYSSGYASTKSEGRALRKLLRLRNVYCYEELQSAEDNAVVDMKDQKISSTQIATINLMCKRHNLNAWELVNSNQKKPFPSTEDIPRSLAIQIIGYLNKVKDSKDDVLTEYQGFVPLKTN